MRKAGMYALAVFAVIGFLAIGDGQAATYKYTDKDGNVGLADDLQAVPKEYRASAVLIGGASKEGSPEPAAPPVSPQNAVGMPSSAPVPGSASAPAAAPAQTMTQPLQEANKLPFSVRLAISIGVVIAAILVSVFLGRISAMHGHDRAIHILRVSLSWLVVVYLVVAHARDVMTLLKVAGSHVQSVSAESAQKGEKAAQAIKALDHAIERAEMQVQEAEKAARAAGEEADRR